MVEMVGVGEDAGGGGGRSLLTLAAAVVEVAEEPRRDSERERLAGRRASGEVSGGGRWRVVVVLVVIDPVVVGRLCWRVGTLRTLSDRSLVDRIVDSSMMSCNTVPFRGFQDEGPGSRSNHLDIIARSDSRQI